MIIDLGSKTGYGLLNIDSGVISNAGYNAIFIKTAITGNDYSGNETITISMYSDAGGTVSIGTLTLSVPAVLGNTANISRVLDTSNLFRTCVSFRITGTLTIQSGTICAVSAYIEQQTIQINNNSSSSSSGGWL